MSASSAGDAPARTAETSARSAPSASRTSMKPRNQRASRARPRPSRRGAARAGSCGGVHGRVGGDVGESVVERGGPRRRVEPRHEVHQARQRRQAAEPAAAAARRRRSRGLAAKHVAAARVGLGRARSTPSPPRAECRRSSPSRSRLRLVGRADRAAASRRRARRRPSTSTGKRRRSSAHWSKVPPVQRSKRAWCQWQVRIPSQTVPRCSGKPMCGQRLSTAYTSSPSAKTQRRVPVDVHDESPRRPQLRERGSADEAVRGGGGHELRLLRRTPIVDDRPNPRTSTMVQVKCRVNSRSASSRPAAASPPRRCASTSGAGLIAATAHDGNQRRYERASPAAASRSSRPAARPGSRSSGSAPPSPRCLPSGVRPPRLGAALDALARRPRRAGSRRCKRCATRLTTCIGCGCLSLDACGSAEPRRRGGRDRRGRALPRTERRPLTTEAPAGPE